ncbi:DUF7561 family protein [Haloarchaeobius litoreus]|uniref:Small CPxCG-related zinc finger protein n=1 Tax=Haloarchaeobius litoreus TaxID=755306 RepID=A0ABD6DK88_9EURY
MSTDPCDGCGSPVKIRGGIGDFWSFFGGSNDAEGMLLTFDSDGSEHLLCYDCIEKLPDEPTAADVAALE